MIRRSLFVMKTVSIIITMLSGLALALLIVSCGQNSSKSSQQSSMQKAYDVLMDSTSTWNDVIEAIRPVRISLEERLSDPNKEVRLKAQRNAYDLSEVAFYKFYDLKVSGNILTDEDWYAAFGDLRMKIFSWFYNENLNALWRDHYCVLQGSTNHPVEASIRLYVFLNDDEESSTPLYIIFPAGTSGRPFIIFSEDPVELKGESSIITQFERWCIRGEEGGEERHLEAYAGWEALSNMMNYPTMYLVFGSGNPDEADVKFVEHPRIALKPFQDWFREKK